MSRLRERPGPRPRTWLALGALVLLAHAALVLDWGALWSLAQPPDRPGASSAAPPGAFRPSAAATAPPPAVLRVAQVRWIAPDATAAAPEPAAVRPTTPPQRPPQAKAPTARPATPQPESQPEPLPELQREAPAQPDPAPTVLAERSAPEIDTPAPPAAREPAPAQPAPSAPPAEATTAAPTTGASRTSERSDALPADQPLQPAPTRPTVLPGNRWLRYDVMGQAKGLNYRASGEVRWQTSDGRYQADFKISAFLIGSRSQQSTGQLTDTGLVPERFADKSRSERAAHFEPEQGRIRFSNNAPDAPWLPGTQDRLSVFFQLAAWLNARPDGLREGQRLSLPVAGTSGADQWQLLVQALEPLDLPAGRWDALRVEVLPQKTFDRRTELWLAPQLDHLPVRIRLTESNGDVADLQLSALP